jgi:hypothetical protein
MRGERTFIPNAESAPGKFIDGKVAVREHGCFGAGVGDAGGRGCR